MKKITPFKIILKNIYHLSQKEIQQFKQKLLNPQNTNFKIMKSVIIIPARFGSSRYKGKPLILINNVPLVIRVIKKCEKVLGNKNVYVATDNKLIAKTVKDYGHNFIMTSKKNLTGTDRVAEASKKINANIIINVQGDEPLINPTDIKKVLNKKKKHLSHIVCGYCDLRND